jgi:hypothetical protein
VEGERGLCSPAMGGEESDAAAPLPMERSGGGGSAPAEEVRARWSGPLERSGGGPARPPERSGDGGSPCLGDDNVCRVG